MPCECAALSDAEHPSILYRMAPASSAPPLEKQLDAELDDASFLIGGPISLLSTSGSAHNRDQNSSLLVGHEVKR